MAKLVDDGAPGVDPAVREQAAAGILTTGGFDAWVRLRDVWGMDDEPSGALGMVGKALTLCLATMQWTVGALLAQLARAGGKRR